MKALLVIARALVILLLVLYLCDLAIQRAVGAAITRIDNATTRTPSPGMYEVKTLLATWHDNARDRDVPVKIYWPGAPDKDAAAVTDAAKVAQPVKPPLPLILFSHGLGGTRNGYAYLGQYWASNGFIVVHVQHLGSDDAVWRGNKRPMAAMRAATKDLDNARNRPKDISFAIDQMLALSKEKDSPFYGLVDAKRIGVAGHSFGAYTVLALAGQGSAHRGLLAKKVMGDLRDDRIKAAMPMSSPVNSTVAAKGGLYDAIDLPMFHMTGTRDSSPIGGTSARDRRIPFDQIKFDPAKHNDNYLLTFTDGDHMVFSGTRRNTLRAQRDEPSAAVEAEGANGKRTILQRDAAEHALIEQASLAFWRAYLLDDATAKTWLQGEGFKKALGNEGTFEMKIGK